MRPSRRARLGTAPSLTALSFHHHHAQSRAPRCHNIRPSPVDSSWRAWHPAQQLTAAHCPLDMQRATSLKRCNATRSFPTPVPVPVSHLKLSPPFKHGLADRPCPPTQTHMSLLLTRLVTSAAHARRPKPFSPPAAV
ncbi:uncharacterized protein CC84DRAFT_490849 [Paraphaeosphaeria sporulosa]|uniref:Uncharacterized protein n=1 Tax=Paraphaeosphaeria sporulosa TaxID=1460663 RepID=A0A177CV01_9PLEO|nr:uncharacterized protein CC84DRAFT_490849 [Paraphaeosphaeria sporulosa]OAG10617.1 hypothetical protein CC84DRAFT_490849 [Paraphaeosphaeria sporulosa]